MEEGACLERNVQLVLAMPSLVEEVTIVPTTVVLSPVYAKKAIIVMRFAVYLYVL